MIGIGAWLAARLVPLAAGAAVMVALFAWDYVRIQKAETRGADSAIVKVERNNAKVSSAARSAGRKSLDGAGVPSPYYRD